MRWFAIVSPFALLLLALASSPGWSQEEEAEEPYLPGLIAEYQQSGRQLIRRLEAAVAASWTARPDERLLAGKPITVAWQGVLLVPDDGPYQLHVHGQGAARIELGGKTIVDAPKLAGWASSAAQSLTFGPLPIRVTYSPGETQPAQLSLFWSSDRFEREPIAARFLVHDRQQIISTEFAHGQVLARALRCGACHDEANEIAMSPMPAPALDQLSGALQRSWFVDWLTAQQPNHTGNEEPRIERRMPYLGLSKEDAELLADWLLAEGKSKNNTADKPAEKPAKRDPKQPAPSRAAGEQLLVTRGCLACHRVGELGESGLFGGGDLTAIASKRPAAFFAQWLQKPETLNRDHRMPVFELTADERESLALALTAKGEAKEARDSKKVMQAKPLEIARRHRCDVCHRLPNAEAVQKLAPPASLKELAASSRWDASCSVSNETKTAAQPKFGLGKAAAAALQAYYSQRQPTADKAAPIVSGEQLLLENNCLACHAREPQPAGLLSIKLADKLVDVAKKYEDLAAQLPAMTPPSLNSIGDKLTDAALANAITRAGPAHRPYLLVQMPKFRLSQDQTAALAAQLVSIDRIPDYERTKTPDPSPQQLTARELAGKRLVGTDGFSCTSCHQVGSVLPVKAPPAARGPTLSMPQDRLRKSWFDRFVRNPARIVPRMEMPSVQTPVRGVLNDNLPEQLAAVWHVLSTPGFEPPLPEPVRTLRFYSSEDNRGKEPLLVTDLIEYQGQTLERAALIGLPNRQNVLFDFATNRLLAWSQGDLARQRTKGKNWYWEPAGSLLLASELKQSEIALEIDGAVLEATTGGQWLAEPYITDLERQQATFEYGLTFSSPGDKSLAKPPISIRAKQIVESLPEKNGVRRRYEFTGLPPQAKVHLRLLGNSTEAVSAKTERSNTLEFPLNAAGSVRVDSPTKASLTWRQPGTAIIDSEKLAQGELLTIAVSYQSTLPADEYHVPRPPPFPFTQPAVTIAPGLVGERLTLPTDMMPTALAWRPNGDLVVASLRGQVLAFDGKSLATSRPEGVVLADGLAAPYGIRAGVDYVDVLAKYGLVRIYRDEMSGTTEFLTVASGWGYTSDYHDWAVGLPQDAAGNYYVALPCFQDNRVDAAKKWRGSVLKLSPRRPTSDRPQFFDIEVLTHGHRFPMGMALNKDGELFVTDNQGNYNPFNELNHVKPGSHFGFVNKGEKAPESHVAPTISIPHPWTRSVNGICFLETPAKLAAKGVKSFGPLEGHLVGCEYDTRRLIRMSWQKVNGDYQGCCYPLTVPTPPEEAPLGPICCEVSPSGELFIGSIRDSGWGAGNNIGEVIRVKFNERELGHGLAEMRATAKGFELDFFQPVNQALAEEVANYSLSSYRRESTPAYGGNDIDRRSEKIVAVKLAENRRRVTLELPQLRAGHVYELRLKSLVPEGAPFFPAEAHYTLRQVVR